MSSIGIPIENISPVMVHKDEWRQARLGKFTASLVGTLIGKESNKGIFTQGAMTYIRNVAGEILTGKPWQKEFFTNATNRGNELEPEAIKWFLSQTNYEFLNNTQEQPIYNAKKSIDTHRLIINDAYSGCTPDALIFISKSKFSKDGERLLASPLEVKCPDVYAKFIELYSCECPEDLKYVDKNYYWQHICQILFCNSFARGGNFVPYHPDFPKKGKIIEFTYALVKDDIYFLKDTLTHATKKLIETVNYLS